jgi:hypothetical protein
VQVGGSASGQRASAETTTECAHIVERSTLAWGCGGESAISAPTHY